MRADLLLVELGLAPSRTRAQELISSGRVVLIQNGQRQAVKKASAQIETEGGARLELLPSTDAVEYVSRGGLKMRGALDRTGLDIKGLRALDVGISTGGFTDCLLQAGASQVVGVDVGHGQLAAKLQADPRVQSLEGINARHLDEPNVRQRVLDLNAGHKFDLLVVDVSFISLTLVLPQAIQYLNTTASVLALVKPQFEVGREGLGKNGIVKDPARYKDVEEKIRRACEEAGLTVEDYFESSIEGTDGNREFFVYARPSQSGSDTGTGHRSERV